MGIPSIGDRWRILGVGVAVTASYVLFAKLGFRVAFVAEQVTTVWAPTGLAQAALVLAGVRLWPAVWLGAFIANAGTTAPLWVAASIATGNTLEAVAAAWILSRVVDFDLAFHRIRDGVAFVVAAALLTPALSATVGVMTLCTAGVQSWTRFTSLWSAWWLGDALGALVVAPLILTASRTARGRTRREWIETALLVSATIVVAHVVFGQAFGSVTRQHPLEYVIVPFIIGTAVRLGQPATSLMVLGASVVTIWHTVHGAGPFASADPHAGLLFLQTFSGVLATTGLLLAAAIDERKTGERRRAAAHAVGELLVRANDFAQVAPDIVRVICVTLRWPFSALWLVDRAAERLRCVAVWADGATSMHGFRAATESRVFTSGVGLPGRVWASGTATWIENVTTDENFPRAAAARAAGLHGAFAFPLCVGTEVIGVLEFFHRSVTSPDTDLLRTMSTVGNEIGQFIARTRSEATVARGHRQTRAILETALDAIIGMDQQGRVTDFNPAAERIFGYTRQQAVGRELAELLIPDALREQHREGLRRYLGTGAGPFIDRRIETTACHADGHTFPVEVAITRVLEDEPPIFTGFVRDLTARVEAEREREQLLQRALAARREAETANRAKDEFLATLSHELRTPLNAITGWTRMLRARTLDERTAERALEVIDRNAQLQAQLVNDILDVSRIITGGMRLEWQPVDLGSVIGAALDSVRPAAEAKKIELRSRLAATARLVEGDPQRLQQIVWNLLVNAVKFTPAGGRVGIVLDEASDGAVAIRVHDDGLGIAEDFLPYVFDRFRQADGSASRQHGGLGLGLAIVRHLAELHGGTVRAESDGPGKGSTFTVELPRADPAGFAITARDSKSIAEVKNASGVQPNVLRGVRILIVDDDEDALDLMSTILAGAGAIVRVAASVREALEHLDGSSPDVLLSDLGMPDKDGFDLIRELRRSDAPRRRRLPAVAVTAYAGQGDRQRALAAGYDACVSKPVSPERIIEIVLTIRSGLDETV